MNRKNIVIAILLSAVVGCGPVSKFKAARKAERKGLAYKAWEGYQRFVASYPSHPLAAEALFHAGLLAQTNLKDCTVAKTFYDGVIEKYPQSDPWARAALLQRDNCPDYFPLNSGTRWVDGDSETKGGNARVESDVISPEKNAKILPGESVHIRKTYFAGATKFKTFEAKYQKKESELHEFPVAGEPAMKVVLRMPLEIGTAWSCKYNSQMFRYEVVETKVKVSVAAGDFENCIKVKSYAEGYPGFTYEYYAPEVGRVLTAISSRQAEEKRNTELLFFTKGIDTSYDAWSGLK